MLPVPCMTGQCFPQNILVNKSLNAQEWKLSVTWQGKFTKRTKVIAIAIAPGCPPELNGTILLLNMTHFGYMMDSQAGADLKTSSLLDSFHRKCQKAL